MSSQLPIVHAYFAAPEPQHEQLRELLSEADHRLIWLASCDALASALHHIRILACAGLPALDWSKATALEHVHVMGAGVDHLELEALPERVLITNSRGIHGPEMRDHVLALMLAFERQLPRLIAQQAEHQWQPFAAGSLSGKTVAILGLGHVGGSIAQACRALGMRVLATRSQPSRPSAFDTFADTVGGPGDTRRFVAAADHLVVCLPATSQTRGFIDADMLAAMAPHAVLIVVGRGGIVDEDALMVALTEGRLCGAALDVFSVEPLPAEHPMWSTPRLLVSPHLAGWSSDYAVRAMTVLLANRQAITKGEAPPTIVTRSRGY